MALATGLVLFSTVVARAAPSGYVPTPTERAWLQAHPHIRVGFDPAWPPFSMATESGGCRGIDADLLARLGTELGVTFDFVSRPDWTAVYDSALHGEMDLLVGTARSPEREQHFLFTQPYFSFPIVIVTRNDEPILWSPLDLAGRRVIGVRDYITTTEIGRRYPDLKMTEVESVAVAMSMIARGEADAFFTNLPNASFVAKTRGLTNLKIAGVMPDTFDLCYAVRPDWPELRAILDHALAALSEGDRQELVHPWIRVDYARVIRWDIVWRVALGVLSVLAVVLWAVLYHNRCLQRELVERIRLQREIKESHDKLVVLNEEKSELLQMAAHDLRGPLTGMQLVVDSSLRLGAVPPDEALKMIEKQMKQMTGLLNDLLDVEALESGRRELRLEEADLVRVLRAAVGVASPLAASKAIRIDASGVAAQLPLVRADLTALRQIFDNLLSNAVKFSPRGTAVTVSAGVRGGFLRVEIADEGPGVPAAETERIFAKYARGTARPTAGEKSTGLGLSIVRQLAGAMNGRVWCENRPDRGATFVFMIPPANAPGPGATPAA